MKKKISLLFIALRKTVTGVKFGCLDSSYHTAYSKDWLFIYINSQHRSTTKRLQRSGQTML